MSTLAVILGAVATYRLAWLVTHDSITAPVRDWTSHKGATSGVWRWVAELVECQWCSSMWIGAGVALTGWWWSGTWWWFSGCAALTFSAVAGIVGTVVDLLAKDRDVLDKTEDAMDELTATDHDR